jgi:hypothetical protein
MIRTGRRHLARMPPLAVSQRITNVERVSSKMGYGERKGPQKKLAIIFP